jgi:hypothetical protein
MQRAFACLSKIQVVFVSLCILVIWANKLKCTNLRLNRTLSLILITNYYRTVLLLKKLTVLYIKLTVL